MASPTGRAIRDELLDAAEIHVRRVGPNGFSYGDLAADVGIKAPSVHHHFRTKDELLAAVTQRYRERFHREVSSIRRTTQRHALLAYAGLFADSARDDQLCLCGMMSAQWTAIGVTSREAVEGFFEDQRRWIECRVRDGVAAGEFRADVDARSTADLLLAGLEGALLMSRAGRSGRLAESVAETLLDQIDAAR